MKVGDDIADQSEHVHKREHPALATLQQAYMHLTKRLPVADLGSEAGPSLSVCLTAGPQLSNGWSVSLDAVWSCAILPLPSG